MTRSTDQLHSFFRNGLRSIHFILTVTISVFAVTMMLAASLMMFSKFEDVLKNNIAANTRQTITQAANTLDFYIKELVVTSDIVLSKLYSVPRDDAKSIQSILDSVQSLKQEIAAAGVYDLSGNIVAIAPSASVLKPSLDIMSQQWYKDSIISDALYTFHPPRVENLFRKQYPWVVTLSRKVSRLDENGQRQQMLLSMDMNFSTLEKHCSNISIGKRGYMYIVDSSNNLIFHPQQQMIYAGIREEDLTVLEGKEDGSYLSDKGDKVVVIQTLTNTDWKLVGVSYLEEQFATRQEITSFLMAMLFIDFVVIVLLSIAISHTLSRPIRNLTLGMEEVRGGNFDIRCRDGGFYEVDSLSKSFNMMVDRINVLMAQIKTEEKLLRKSELRALQAQINPHFLYNTLDSIMWMCEQNQGQRASLMVEALATLFRISISKGNELITIKEELLHAESYLTIQKMRYRDQFDYTVEVEQGLMPCHTLKILLQPMIENAIYHGIDRMVDKGKIQIKVYTESSVDADFNNNNNIIMEIQDNGLGMPEDVAREIITRQGSKSSYGIGVKNVNDRIQIYFGKEYGLAITSELDVGTTVKIKIPRLDDDTYEH